MANEFDADRRVFDDDPALREEAEALGWLDEDLCLNRGPANDAAIETADPTELFRLSRFNIAKAPTAWVAEGQALVAVKEEWHWRVIE